LTIEQQHRVVFGARTNTVDDGGKSSVGLTEAVSVSTQANDACGAVRRGEDALDLAPATFGTAVSAFPELAPLDGVAVRTGVHYRCEAFLCTMFILVWPANYRRFQPQESNRGRRQVLLVTAIPTNGLIGGTYMPLIHT
jgi:hypothetical protein